MNPSRDPHATAQNFHNPLAVMQEGERVICEVKRHPAGLWGMYFSIGLLLILVVVGAVAAPMYMPGLSSQAKLATVVGCTIFGIILLLYIYVARSVYRGNRWVVTSDSLTQISQISLFRSQTSQLSMANLEDVSVSQSGILQSILGYGTLKVETAGEHSKFTFPYCPKPNERAREIIAAHEEYIAHNPEEMYTTNRPLANAAAFNQPYGPVQPQQPAAAPSAPAAAQPAPPAVPTAQPQQPPVNNQNRPPQQ